VQDDGGRALFRTQVGGLSFKVLIHRPEKKPRQKGKFAKREGETGGKKDINRKVRRKRRAKAGSGGGCTADTEKRDKLFKGGGENDLPHYFKNGTTGLGGPDLQKGDITTFIKPQKNAKCRNQQPRAETLKEKSKGNKKLKTKPSTGVGGKPQDWHFLTI